MSSLSTKYRSGTKVQHQLFISSGTWNKPVKFIEGTLLLTGIGGGASGNKVSSAERQIGGNSGEYVYEMYVNVSSSPTVTVTIGAGGASITGTAPLSGNSGSPTTFGALVTLAGAVAGSTIAQGASVGGAFGGLVLSSLSDPVATPPQPLFCAKAGSCGGRLSGNYGYLGSAEGIGIGNSGGAGGLVLDGTGKKAGDTTNVTGGIGYGAGGASEAAINSGAGASGAIFLTWQEYI